MSSKWYYERIDIGSKEEQSDFLHQAKNALVVMVVSLDSNWKIPIGYFLIDGIDATTNAGLISESLTRLHEIGVTVVSLTLDGPLRSIFQQ